ncbi:acetyltransferase [Xanthomonas phage PBR31]|uniref:Acetyltransferase n=1 Tax=Xanthomonas phage PPDBI TaxID=2723911 RepID=A0A6H0X5P9_9CAUD|nr:hypothetical protein [Ralstonia pickettii]NYS10337.1 hypothetical protein [Ralstonia pickettii]QIN95339.1 acetyltransferase [Xanthomonas phage PBR31]QIW89387.1 acetyltransferase [Xanthomonas phage PPDBI]
MASNKIVRIGPVALGTSAANIANPPTVSGGVGLAGTNSATYLIIRHLRLVNKTSSTQTASLFIGASGASASGTEFAFNGKQIFANDSADWYGLMRLDVADFLTGIASAANSITLEGEAEIGIV